MFTNNSRTKTAILASVAISLALTGSHAALIYTDNFNIADTNSLDGSDQTGRHSGLAANDIVLRSGGVQHTIGSNQLNLLLNGVGSGRVRFQSAAALPGNALFDFASGAVGAQILADGGFRLEFDWTPADSSGTNWISLNLGTNYFDTDIGVNNGGTDFGILFRNNGLTEIFDNSVFVGAPAFDASVLSQHHAAIDFSFTSFADGSAVTANISVDNVAVGGPVVFDWNGNAGVINLELGHITTVRQLDNVSISTVPEPTSLALLGLAGLAFAGRRRRQA